MALAIAGNLRNVLRALPWRINGCSDSLSLTLAESSLSRRYAKASDGSTLAKGRANIPRAAQAYARRPAILSNSEICRRRGTDRRADFSFMRGQPKSQARRRLALRHPVMRNVCNPGTESWPRSFITCNFRTIEFRSAVWRSQYTPFPGCRSNREEPGCPARCYFAILWRRRLSRS